MYQFQRDMIRDMQRPRRIRRRIIFLGSLALIVGTIVYINTGHRHTSPEVVFVIPTR